MYYLVGDFMRLGPTKTDPLHSTLSHKGLNGIVVTMNRPQRRILIHVWQMVSPAENGPDMYEPVSSNDLMGLRDSFIIEEARNR